MEIIFFLQDNYKTARAIEIAAIDLSTNDETPLENITNKAEVSKRRPRKKPARFINSDDGSSDEIESTISIHYLYILYIFYNIYIL